MGPLKDCRTIRIWQIWQLCHPNRIYVCSGVRVGVCACGVYSSQQDVIEGTAVQSNLSVWFQGCWVLLIVTEAHKT